MIEVLQPGHFVAAAAGLGVVYAVYRIAKSNREIRKSVKDLDNRVEPKLGNLSAQLNCEVAGRQMADNDLSRRISDIERARRNERRPGGDLHRAVDAFADSTSKPFRGGRFPGSKSVTSAPGNSSTSSINNRQNSETPLSSPLQPANPLNPIYADDTPSRSSSSSHSSHDSGCSSRSSSSYSGGSSSSGSYDSGSSSSDSGSCSSSD